MRAKSMSGHCNDGGGIQKHSAGELYPWVNKIVENYTDGLGTITYIHPDGRETKARHYVIGDSKSFRQAHKQAERDAAFALNAQRIQRESAKLFAHRNGAYVG